MVNAGMAALSENPLEEHRVSLWVVACAGDLMSAMVRMPHFRPSNALRVERTGWMDPSRVVRVGEVGVASDLLLQLSGYPLVRKVPPNTPAFPTDSAGGDPGQPRG